MHFYGISSALEVVNGFSGYAPEDVFHNPPLDFESFKTRLKEHFKDASAAPIMIDDGTYALNIVGIGGEGMNTTLWIADPHIKSGVNKSGESSAGLYTVTLDNDGNQTGCYFSNGDKDKMMFPGSYEGIGFNRKKWMVLFPLKKISV